MFILETLNFVVDILKVPSVLVAYNVFAKNKPAGGNAQENTGAKS